MLKNAIDEHKVNKPGEEERVKINTKEIENGEIIPTYKLMRGFENEYPDYEFFFVCGSDLFPSMHLWEDGTKLKDEIKFLIFNRPGAPSLKDDEFPERYVQMDYSKSQKMSSTEIRNILKWESPIYHSP